MVADSERNRRYHRAIARAVYSQPEGRRRVLDIGAGSGLLGLLAAKHVRSAGIFASLLFLHAL